MSDGHMGALSKGELRCWRAGSAPLALWLHAAAGQPGKGAGVTFGPALP